VAAAGRSMGDGPVGADGMGSRPGKVPRRQTLVKEEGLQMAKIETPLGEADGTGGAVGACTLMVEGLDCASCAESVDRALRAVEGVAEVRTDVVGERVTVSYRPGRVDEAALRGAISRAGYRVREEAPPPGRAYEVEGLCCATEARQIEGRLAGRPDVERLDFDFVRKRVTVVGRVSPAVVERAVAELGMRARAVGRDVEPAAEWDRRKRLALVVAAGILWAGSALADYLLGLELVAAGLAIGAIFVGGRYIIPRGLRAVRNRALDMNFLMSVAAVGALAIGEYFEAASAMFLFALAQLLESRSMDRARNAIRGLMDLSPVTATVLREGREVRVPAEEVRVGEVVVIRPGEKVSVDGEVVAGMTSVNQAPITGESIPVEKEPGAEVFAGTLNGEGVLEVRSTRPAEDTTLARIIHSVEEAQATRAPSQTFVDRFARVYTPAVVVAAVLLAVGPPLLGWGEWNVWIYRALVLLVVACPCALVISTPVTIVSALAGAARRGILIKGGLHLENAGRSRVIALDKTGTLTRGEPTVLEVVPLGGHDAGRVIAWAAAAEVRSEHPIARAILRHASHTGIVHEHAIDAAAIPGKGVKGWVEGRLVYAGTERLFRELGASVSAVRPELDRLEAAGRTAILVGTSGPEGGPVEIAGVIAVADRLRDHAPRAIQELRRAGIERIVMLTGDNPGTARAVAESLPGLDEYRAELLPADKVHAVRELRARYGRVAFVGDGINDAPALAASDVGIAMGSAGTDVALETADIALMTDDLERLSTTIRLARKAEGIIRANIALSLLTKAAFVALAVMGWATLWMAVAADMGTSLVVIMNGMRALRI
jgi:Zn2+/Cd2+-exporting ATPase